MARLIQKTCMTVLALSLAACGGEDFKQKKVDKADATGGFNLSKMIGSDKTPPDEFAVISAAPLEMPQDFAALPSPDLGARSPRLPDAQSEARELLLGESTPQAANARTSVSEAALLSAAGPSDPNIRAALVADQAEVDAEQDLYVLDNIIPALKSLRQPELDKDIVVPLEERERLASASSRPRAGASGIATIPSGSAPITMQPVSATPQATIPQTTLPSAPAARPSVDPETGGELIYIPE